MSLSVKIATPEKLVYEEQELVSITLPTTEGEITILPGHIPLVSKIAPGEILIKKKGKTDSFACMSGFLKLDALGNVVVLSDYAIRSSDIELAKVEEARKRAEQRMKEKISEEDFLLAQLELTRTLLELKIVKKHKTPRVGI